MTIEQQCAEALARITKHINAAAGQHKRAITKAGLSKGWQGVCNITQLQKGGEGSTVGLTRQGIDFDERFFTELDAVVKAKLAAEVQKADGVRGRVKGDDAVQNAVMVEKPEQLISSGEGVVGLFLKEGRYFLVEGQRVHVLNGPGLHLSAPGLGYALKYYARSEAIELNRVRGAA